MILKTQKSKTLRALLGLVVLVLSLQSCSSDEDAAIPNLERVVKVDSQPKEGKNFYYTPNLTDTLNKKYYWYSDQELISNSTNFTYTFKKAGENKIGLRVVENQVSTHYTYIFNVLPKNLNYVTLDLSQFDLSQGIATQGGVYWAETYKKNHYVSSQIFTFSHTAEESWNYWDGFVVSNSTDNSNHGEAGNSVGWLPFQWGNMAQGGVKGKGSPYIVGYWGYYAKDFQAQEGVFDEKMYSNWVKIGDQSEQYEAVSVQIANHPWPYYGNLHGDGFARAFKTGDYFKIRVYGVDANNNVKPDHITHYLADYRGSELIMSQKWEKLDLSALGEVKYIFFQLESTDADATVGPNTAVYFCMDQLVVDKI